MDTTSNSLKSILDTTWKNAQEERKPLEERWEKSRKNIQYIFDEAETWKAGEGDGWRSRTCTSHTRQKVVGAYDIAIDMVLQDNRVPFALLLANGTPMPETEADAKAVEEAIRQHKQLIQDQLLAGDSDRQLMRNVFSLAAYGETYGKRIIKTITAKGFTKISAAGPASAMSTAASISERWEQTGVPKKVPAWTWVSNWNIFRDMESDNPAEWSYIIERTYQPNSFVRGKIGLKKDIFFDDELRAVLSKSATDDTMTQEEKNSLPPHQRNIKHRNRKVRWVEMWCSVPDDALREFEKERGIAFPSAGAEKTTDEPVPDVEVFVVIANTRIVGLSRVNREMRQHAWAVWNIDVDEAGGVGVADAMKPTQKILNGIMRALEDGKRVATNAMSAMKYEYIENAPKALTPGGQLEITADCDDVRKAIQWFVPPDATSGLTELLDRGERWSEDDTLLPRISHGLPTPGSETAYEVSKRVEAAGKHMAASIRNLDEGLIEPMISWFYQYNMEDPECKIPKLNLIVKPLGFSSYQDRILNLIKYREFLGLLMQTPDLARRYRIDRIIDEKLGPALDIDTERYRKTGEELQAETQALTEQQAVAQQLAQAEQQAKTQKLTAEAQHKMAAAEATGVKAKADMARTVSGIEEAIHTRRERQAGALRQPGSPPAPKPPQPRA